MAYVRYTEFSYDPQRRDDVLAYWRHPDTSHPTDQPGFIRGVVSDSEEQPGTLRVLTMWHEQAQFDAYFATPGHRNVGPSLADISAEITVRDGLRTVLELEAPAHPRDSSAGHIRIIRARLLDGADVDALRAFWQSEGRAALEAAPGAHAARAYLDAAAGLFVIQVWWESESAAQEFVASDDHEQQLTVPLSRWVERLDRVEATPLD